ncbi:MarR family winged helix-turn-helix transcriptional regulator [Glaciihabitans sp. dw_435]|uniref:MarR family winged helix-turn-helix transcriptional regulator n=1 Tax=Glaciihabitans sp. dw_435 TaxID=2720081 RepID=UPI001BD30482|nr:MarR family transcriptional regulator [Glaciihabitans sp. dw_435]
MDDDNFELDLRLAVQRLARRLRAQRAGADITDGQYAVLSVLARHDGLGLGELSEHERVTASSMNRTVNALVEAGYATRTGSDDDGRKVVLRLSDEGRAVVEETRRRRGEWFSVRLAELSDGDREKLRLASSILQSLADAS